MAGILIPIIPITPFDFSFMTSTAGTKTIVIHPAINVIPYYYAKLIVRVHQIDIAAGRTLKVSALGCAPSKEDSQEFVNTAAATLEVSLTSATTVGLTSSSIDTDTDMLPFLKVQVSATWVTANATIFALLSADLLLREA